MRKKIIAITAATLLLATACGCGSQQEPDSTPAKTPDVSAQQAKPQQQAAEKTAQSFVDEFNANSSTQITDVEKFTPSDANGPYYRAEYRTGAFSDADRSPRETGPIVGGRAGLWGSARIRGKRHGSRLRRWAA